MLFEIEITEEEIKNEIDRNIKDVMIKKSVLEYINSYWVEQEIKNVIKKCWKESIEDIVRKEVENAPEMRERIKRQLENKIRRQLEFLIKENKSKN